MTHTTKHCAFGPGNGQLLEKIIQMAAVIVGGIKQFAARPIVSFTTCPVSPLKLIKECCEIIMVSAQNNVVCTILSMAMAGATSPATLATDVIQEIGLFGDFLAHAHTFAHMREQSNAKLIDRRMRSDWELDGSTDSYTRARKYVLHILENHQPDPLPDEVLREIRQIVTDTERDLGLLSEGLLNRKSAFI